MTNLERAKDLIEQEQYLVAESANGIADKSLERNGPPSMGCVTDREVGRIMEVFDNLAESNSNLSELLRKDNLRNSS